MNTLLCNPLLDVRSPSEETQQVAEKLRSLGINCAAYHAGLEEISRAEIQDLWNVGKIHVVVATIAFGLGINKPNVRLVIHFTLSKSVELYYQEAGRAGRDDERARCVILYHPADAVRIATLAAGEVDWEYSQGHRFCVPRVLNMVKYCHNRLRCRRDVFAETLQHEDLLKGSKRDYAGICDGHCDVCSSSLKTMRNLEKESILQCEWTKPPVTLLETIFTILKKESEPLVHIDESNSGMTLKQLHQHKLLKHELVELGWDFYEFSWLIMELCLRRHMSIILNFTPYTVICYFKLGWKEFDFHNNQNSVISRETSLQYKQTNFQERHAIFVPKPLLIGRTDDKAPQKKRVRGASKPSKFLSTRRSSNDKEAVMMGCGESDESDEILLATVGQQRLLVTPSDVDDDFASDEHTLRSKAVRRNDRDDLIDLTE